MDDTGHRSGATNVPLDEYWMPFTHNRGFKSDPRLLLSASGMHYLDANGQKVLDGTAGLWCVNAGHGREPIVRAIADQASELDYAPSFQIGHPIVFRLAERLARRMPAGLSRIFFTSSGSEAVDSALKIALAYHRCLGAGSRSLLIGRERAYHGTGFGGISVGGIVSNRRQFAGQLLEVDHLPHTHNLAEAAFSNGQPQWGAHLADDLLRLVALHGAENIAAVIVEPVAGSTGVLVPPIGYLERLREITREHGILLVFDEVITAFGRLGATTAAERFAIVPDMITLAKGLTNGTVPMGAVAVQKNIYDTICDASDFGIELFHGYTYSGHPLAAAAALASLDVYEGDQLFERATRMQEFFADSLHRLRQEPHVIDIRNLGMVGAVELAPRKGEPGRRGFELFRRCLDSGVLVRATGDTIAISPPLIIDEQQIGEIVEVIEENLRELA